MHHRRWTMSLLAWAAPALVLLSVTSASAVNSIATPTTSTNYTAYPPFINQTVPPLVMITMSKDHRMFIMAYNDIMDLNGDGTVETTYTDIINYYGYFDPNKCYSYVTANNRFEPQGVATGTNAHYCSNQWSGNFLNWGTMVRIDVVRKVLYGGARSVDTSGASAVTVLRRTWLPQDAHSFAKAYSGSDLASLAPTTSLGVTSGSITLCNTNTTDYTSGAGGTVLVFDGNYPYSASTESSGGGVIGQCTRTQNNSTTKITPKTTSPLNVDVLVCVPGKLEANCDTYQDTATPTPNSWYKPTGLMQRMGVNRQGTYSNTSDDTIQMKFALISGSYGAHVGGGVLRSNIVDLNSEINPSTGVVQSTSQIIKNMNNFRIVQYKYSTGWYDGTSSSDNCNQGEPLVLQDTTGYCKSWGNPVGEMMYEAIRYYMGKSGPTPQFQVSSPDFGLSGLSVVSSWSDPYGTCPYCSKPFVLLFSDASPSYDSDHLPGYYSGWSAPLDPISTNDTPSVTTLTSNANMNTLENIGNVFIGQSGTTYDQACSPKTGDFTKIRGLCTEEPTKQGSFYVAGLANYASITDLRGPLGNDTKNQVKQSITTYSVVTNSPFPTLQFTVRSNTVQVVPDFFDGCPKANWGSPGYTGCSSVGKNGDSSKGELVYFKLCPNDTDWTTEQGNGFTSCYEIMWDDAEYGWDYDLDVLYRLYVKTDSAGGTITLQTKGLYAAAGHTDYAGYFINGVSGSGSYLDLVCGGATGAGETSWPLSGQDCDTYNNITPKNDGMGNSVSQRTFSVTGATTQILKDPLWYAAKYGGFTDQDGSNTPNLQSEWDANGDGVPDTYFYAVSPLYLEQQLANAFASILNRASSGTAASVLASSTTGEGALYQSYFFPVLYDNEKAVKYTGYTQALFVDAFGNLREDTNSDGRLIYTDDRILVSRYDPNQNATVADLYVDTNGDGKADGPAVSLNVNLQLLKPIWEAGRRLALLSDASRKLFTWIDKNNNSVNDGGELIPFDTSGTHTTDLSPYLNTDATYTAAKLIPFIRGCDPTAPATLCPANTNFRNRSLTVTDDTGTSAKKVWKLGDPVYATPVIIGAPRERFDVLYGDTGYSAFFKLYQTRRQVAYVGANDGMLHAFNVGFYHPGDDPSTTGSTQIEHGWFTNGPALADGRTPVRGDELWGFIPQAALPHLRWLADPAYAHTFYVDLKPKITDVRIFCQAATGATVPAGPVAGSCVNGQAGVTHPGGWGTILIGGMRMGGSCGHCATNGNGAPMVVKDDFNGNGTSTDPDDTRTFYSSYFVLDITDPEHDPVLLWTFSHQDLGLTTSFPAVMRVKGVGNKTDMVGEKWVAVFGSGPTSYNGSTGQNGRLFIVDLVQGPTSLPSSGAAVPNNLVTVVDASAVTANGTFNAFMGDLVSVDRDLDFRDDAIFAGQVINDTRGGSVKPWRGLLIRLTTGCQAGSSSCQTDPSQWGLPGSGSLHVPTQVLDQFTDAATITQTLGPIATAPAVVVDQQNHLWLFTGTGRYYSVSGTPSDQSDTSTQYLVGVKDRLFNNTCGPETTITTCQAPQPTGPAKVLIDMTSATVCIQGSTGCATASQVAGVSQLGSTGTGSFDNLINLIQNQDGWFAKLGQSPAMLGERMFATPEVFGGLVLFPTFVPSPDPCVAAGNSYLYALYYLTGGPYSDPIFPSSAADTQVASRTNLGQGLATTVALHLGSQGSGQVGGGSQSGLIGCSQSSTGALNCVQLKPTDRVASRYLSWRDQRD